MRKAGQSKEVIKDTVMNPEPPSDFNYEQAQKEILGDTLSRAIDGGQDDDKGPTFLLDEDDLQKDPTMTLNPPEVSEGRGMTSANYVEKRPGDGFKDTRDIENPKVKQGVSPQVKTAKPATEIDLENLDESKIMDLPFIKAATFEVMDMLNLRPKDKTLRFRWANYKNYVAGNLARYFALGYTIASIDDVDQTKQAVDPSMVDGTQVKYYDIILLKIPVLRLMELYKANIVKSVNRLSRFRERGIREANRQFSADISSNPGLSNAYNKMKAGLGGREPVEFFTPGVEESQVVGS